MRQNFTAATPWTAHPPSCPQPSSFIGARLAGAAPAPTAAMWLHEYVCPRSLRHRPRPAPLSQPYGRP
jgi:hypothetical protein